MPVTDPINATINASIKPNGVGAITATVLATTLTAMTAWVALYFAPLASNTTLYVASTGSDANAGTSASPPPSIAASII